MLNALALTRQSDIVAYIAVGLLALSNGYVATNSMMLGPQQVPMPSNDYRQSLPHNQPCPHHQVGTAQQEHAGNIMAFMLLIGLTIGSIIGEIFPFIVTPDRGDVSDT